MIRDVVFQGIINDSKCSIVRDRAKSLNACWRLYHMFKLVVLR